MSPKFDLPYQFEIILIMEKEKQVRDKKHLYLRKGHSETLHHILIKIFAYCYFWNEQGRIIIEPNFRYLGYKPDLLKLVPSENPRRLKKEVGLWVECKDVKLKKLYELARALPQSRIFWFNRKTYFKRFLKNDKKRERFSFYENLHLVGIEIDKKKYNFLANQLRQEHLEWIFRRKKDILKIKNGKWNEQIRFRKF